MRCLSKYGGLVFSILLISCQSEYDQLVKKEIQSGIIYEDLIFGIKMGQTDKEFFDICWKLNNQQRVNQGPKNRYVRYVMKPNEIQDETAEIEMLFYAIFDDDNIVRGIKKRYSYSSWAPWNEERHATVLLKKIKKHYLSQYEGNDFIEVDIEREKIKSYVKIDGNRQILIYSVDSKEVIVKIEDTRFKYQEV